MILIERRFSIIQSNCIINISHSCGKSNLFMCRPEVRALDSEGNVQLTGYGLLSGDFKIPHRRMTTTCMEQWQSFFETLVTSHKKLIAPSVGSNTCLCNV